MIRIEFFGNTNLRAYGDEAARAVMEKSNLEQRLDEAIENTKEKTDVANTVDKSKRQED